MFDAGALDDLLDERSRRQFIALIGQERLRLLVPPTVLTEFLVGHPGDAVRADRALRLCTLLTDTPEVARRAAALLMAVAADRGRTPSVSDGMVAVFGEAHGAVATADLADFAALADAGEGFHVYDVRELRALLR